VYNIQHDIVCAAVSRKQIMSVNTAKVVLLKATNLSHEYFKTKISTRRY